MEGYGIDTYGERVADVYDDWAAFRLDDRRVREVGCERRVFLGVIGPPLGLMHVVPRSLVLKVLADTGDLLVPRPLHVTQAAGDPGLALLRRVTELVGLLLSRFAR